MWSVKIVTSIIPLIRQGILYVLLSEEKVSKTLELVSLLNYLAGYNKTWIRMTRVMVYGSMDRYGTIMPREEVTLINSETIPYCKEESDSMKKKLIETIKDLVNNMQQHKEHKENHKGRPIRKINIYVPRPIDAE